ncbi:hypothetical protein PRUPE_3G120000 [Prunus persica]|uniref:Uncharacterized protein n=1 Tax=Prunus persica TaxID=3760 RepID=M5WIF2_PRUPE|nr:hypothetical protein PRUPE_3G120000 [Prunus persica]
MLQSFLFTAENRLVLAPLFTYSKYRKTLTLYKLAFMAQAKDTNFSSTNTSSLGCCKHPSSHQPPSATTIPLSFLYSTAASIPVAIPVILN